MWVSTTLQHHPRVSTLARFPSVPNKVPETNNLWRRKVYLGLWLGGFSLWLLEPWQSSIAWWKHMMNTAIHTSSEKSRGKETRGEHSHSYQQPEVRGKETGPQTLPRAYPVTFPLGPAFSTDSHIFNSTWAFERHWDLKYNKTMWSITRTWKDQNFKTWNRFLQNTKPVHGEVKPLCIGGSLCASWVIVNKLLRSPEPFTSQYTYLQPPSIPQASSLWLQEMVSPCLSFPGLGSLKACRLLLSPPTFVPPRTGHAQFTCLGSSPSF